MTNSKEKAPTGPKLVKRAINGVTHAPDHIAVKTTLIDFV
jgi:hypothetical protein